MTGKTQDIEKLLADDALIESALAKGVREALRRHKQFGLPVVEWRNGKIVWVFPEDIGRVPKTARRKAATTSRGA